MLCWKQTTKRAVILKWRFLIAGARRSIADEARFYFDLSKQTTVRSKQLFAKTQDELIEMFLRDSITHRDREKRASSAELSLRVFFYKEQRDANQYSDESRQYWCVEKNIINTTYLLFEK